MVETWVKIFIERNSWIPQVGEIVIWRGKDRAKLLSGSYWGEHGVSNFWTAELLESSEKVSGYCNDYDFSRIIG
jgi:hypothetical protein